MEGGGEYVLVFWGAEREKGYFDEGVFGGGGERGNFFFNFFYKNCTKSLDVLFQKLDLRMFFCNF